MPVPTSKNRTTEHRIGFFKNQVNFFMSNEGYPDNTTDGVQTNGIVIEGGLFRD